MGDHSPQSLSAFTAQYLTMVPDKTRYYVAEQAYRTALGALVPPGVDADTAAALGTRIQRIGLGLFRPDAIAHDRVEPTLAYLRRLGIRPFHAQVVNVCGPTVRELWRYQLDLVFDAGHSVIAFFRHIQEPPVPCAVLIADAKGPASPARREGWELRAFLGSPNRIEVYFHAADEPVDVVREGGILLGPGPLAQLLSAHLTGTDPAWRDATDDVLRLSSALRSVPGPPLRDPLLARMAEEYGVAGAANDRWAVLRTLGEQCPMFRDGARNLVRQTGSREWWARSQPVQLSSLRG
jgi:hypothetical protein